MPLVRLASCNSSCSEQQGQVSRFPQTRGTFCKMGDLIPGPVPAGVIIQNIMRSDSVSGSHLPRATAFEPERWRVGVDGVVAPGALANAAKRISMPFGAGPRICPGRYLALLEVKMAIAVLLGNFEIENVATPDGGEAREHLAFAMQPVGLRMRLRVRVPVRGR